MLDDFISLREVRTESSILRWEGAHDQLLAGDPEFEVMPLQQSTDGLQY